MNSAHKKRFNVLKIGRSLFYLLSISFLLYGIFELQIGIEDRIIVSDQSKLFYAFIFYCGSAFLAPLCSLVISKTSGNSISYTLFFVTYITSIPAKYIPGGVWQSVGRAEKLSQEPNVSVRWAVALITIENIFSLYLGSVLALFYYGIVSNSSGLVFLSFALLFQLLILMGPMRKKIPILKNDWQFNFRKSISVISAYTLSWSVLATSFYLFILAIEGSGGTDMIYVYMSYYVSWVAGFVAIFAPQGMGVFEGVAATLLFPGLPIVQAASIVFGYRLLICIADLTLWCAYHVFVRVKKLNPAK